MASVPPGPERRLRNELMSSLRSFPPMKTYDGYRQPDVGVLHGSGDTAPLPELNLL